MVAIFLASCVYFGFTCKYGSKVGVVLVLNNGMAMSLQTADESGLWMGLEFSNYANL